MQNFIFLVSFMCSPILQHLLANDDFLSVSNAIQSNESSENDQQLTQVEQAEREIDGEFTFFLIHFLQTILVHLLFFNEKDLSEKNLKKKPNQNFFLLN